MLKIIHTQKTLPRLVAVLILFVQKPDSLLNEDVSFIKSLDLTQVEIVDDCIEIGSGVTIEQFKIQKLLKHIFLLCLNN